MTFIKKFAFAPVFLIFFALTSYLLAPVLKSPLMLLPIDLPTLVNLSIQLFILTAVLLLTSLFFIIFASLAQDLRLIIPVTLLGSFCPLFFIPSPLSFILTGGFLAGVLIIYPMLLGKLNNYLTFQPTVILVPSIKNLTILMIIVISFASYLSLNLEIQKNGFKIPDPLIDSVLKIAGSVQSTDLSNPANPNVKGVEYVAQLPQLTQEQVDLLKQQPGLLKQYGIDPKTLDQLSSVKDSASDNNSATSLVKSAIENMIKPFIPWIPAVLAVSLFSILFSNQWVLSFFIPPVIWLIFWILEKSGFIKFTTEMREVKKMVVSSLPN